jgi:predicted dehydrogenase
VALQLGMIGGGQGAFIGAVHRHAAALDGRWRFVAGALSATPEKSLASARALGLPADRSYGSWRDLIAGERKRPAEDRVDAVTVVTPNATHFEICSGLLEAGLNVIVDKPMVTTVEHARSLKAAAKKSGRILAVTYNYTGYPMVRQAAAIVRSGDLGPIRKVIVEYHQGWLATALEKTGQKQAAWRLDPKQAGPGGALGDIGSHAENLLSTVTGLKIESLRATLTSFVPDRPLDDDALIQLKLAGGAAGHISISQVCVGEENNLTLRVFGERGSITWAQEHPNQIRLARPDGLLQVLSRANANPGVPTNAAIAGSTRLPPGHPEGFIEAFANVYRGIADAIERGSGGGEFPTVTDGARGVSFIDAAVRSHRAGGEWVTM